jgi:O-antigen/teichoic acid export membrane protein
MKKWTDKIGEGGFLFISTLIVNIGNYGINLLLGRFLGPEEFAAANILTTIVLVLSFTALGFQLATAKFVATYQAEGLLEKLDSFITWIKKYALIFSVSVSFLLILVQEGIRSYLNFESSVSLVMLFVAIPLYIDMSVSRGYFQGTNQFKKLAYTYIAEMFARLLVTGILVYICLFLHQTWAIEAIAIGFIAAFAAASYFGRVPTFNIFKATNFAQSRKVFLFLGVVAMYEFSQIIINNSDVILAKHFFENKEAGLYASLALIGRVVYFATWTIVTLLFPMVIEKEKKGEPHVHLFWSSVGVVTLFGTLITLGCYFFDVLIVSILFGEAYLSTAPLLWKYAVATTLFSCANVFVYYHMSLENYTPVFISLAIGLMQIAGIYYIHNGMESIILVQIVLMATMFITMSIYQRVYSIKRRKINQKLKTSIILKSDIS